MKTSLEIINKMSDQEAVKLESQKVELAMFKSVQEIEKMYAEFLKKSQDGSKYISAIRQAQIGLNSTGKIINVEADRFIAEATKTINEAKALGLTAPASITNLPAFAKSIKGKATAYFKLANAIDSNIKGI